MTLTGKEKLFLLYKMMFLVKYLISLSKNKEEILQNVTSDAI